MSVYRGFLIDIERVPDGTLCGSAVPADGSPGIVVFSGAHTTEEAHREAYAAIDFHLASPTIAPSPTREEVPDGPPEVRLAQLAANWVRRWRARVRRWRTLRPARRAA